MKVLVVDDDIPNLAVTTEQLKALGIQTIAVGDAKSAIRFLLRDSEIRIILLDACMPKIDGFALSKAARLLGFEVPIIMLTALSDADPDLQDRALQSGVNEWYTKPVTPSQLVKSMCRYVPSLKDEVNFDMLKKFER